jgi:hypothetical protein
MLQSGLRQLAVDELLYQRRPLLDPLLVRGVGFRGEDDLAAGAKILQARQGDLPGLSTRSASRLTAASSASGLEARVAAQVEELGRVGRLKRFLAPQLAELIVSQGDEKVLESHRGEIVVVFCDLRGYAAFTETAEPEEVLDFLREYHGALGPLVSQYEGTLDQFSGDGIMVFFNDPVPCPDPAERAAKMAMAMREEAGKLIATWRCDGCELGFRRRHRTGLRHIGPDRVFRTLRLHRHRHGVTPHGCVPKRRAGRS